MKYKALIFTALLILAFSAGFVMASFYTSRQYPTETVTATLTAYTTVRETVTIGDIQRVCFSGVDDCSSIIVNLIDSAEKYVHVAIYSFTLDSLGDVLIRARDRGVEVKVVIEREQAEVKGSEYERLLKAGINVRLDGNKYLMHHKFMVVDGRIVVTGSYNWSYGAEENNDENMIVVSNPDVARLYEAEFQRVWGQAS
jgi:phosphatidylserine/phosphatidylglycerophosphate/cardiolipin synthase-like enzyme